MRVGKVDLDTVYRLSLILFLGLQDELLENGVIPGNNAVMDRTSASRSGTCLRGNMKYHLIDKTSQPLPSVFLLRRTLSQWPL
jgi:hypothetical protein